MEHRAETDMDLDLLADEAFRLLGGQLIREMRCGRGAYGAVWLAREKMTRRRLAVKVVRKDPGGAWVREHTGVRHYCERIRHVHPHLLVIHHLAEGEAFFCYSMEAADNAHAESDVYQPDTLGLRLRRGIPFPLEDVKRFGRQLMEALQCLHGAGLVHRDLKPDNIVFVDKEVRLADIGLVSLIHPELSIVGTPDYIPENQMRTVEADGVAQDTYALGKVLYCLMSGCSVNQFPKMPAAVSGHRLYLPLNDAILTACHPNPARRFQNIREFHDVWAAEPCSSCRLQTVKRVALLLAACGAFALLCVAGALSLRSCGGQPAGPPPPGPGVIVFQESFTNDNPNLWLICDAEDRNAWAFGRKGGLLWVFSANGTNALFLALTGFELPASADIAVTLTDEGASGSYSVFFYNDAESGEMPLGYFRERQRILKAGTQERNPYREHIRLIDKRQVSGREQVITLRKKPEDAPFNRLAILYASTPRGDGRTPSSIRIHAVTIRAPETRP